jgi:hypothetical protein
MTALIEVMKGPKTSVNTALTRDETVDAEREVPSRPHPTVSLLVQLRTGLQFMMYDPRKKRFPTCNWDIHLYDGVQKWRGWYPRFVYPPRAQL